MEQAKGYQTAGSTGVPLVTKKTQAKTGTNESAFRRFLVSLIECLKMFCCCCCPQDHHENNQGERERLITKKEDTEESTPLLKKRAEQAATSTETVLTETVPAPSEKKVTATTAATAIQKADIPEIAPTRVDVFLSLEKRPNRFRFGTATDIQLTRKSLKESCVKLLSSLNTMNWETYNKYGRSFRFELFCSDGEKPELLILGFFTFQRPLRDELQDVEVEQLANALFETANRQFVGLALRNAWEHIQNHDIDYQTAKRANEEASINSTAYNKGSYSKTLKQYQENQSDIKLRKEFEKVQKEYQSLQRKAKETKEAFNKVKKDLKEKWKERILQDYDGEKLVDHTFVRARLEALLSTQRV